MKLCSLVPISTFMTMYLTMYHDKLYIPMIGPRVKYVYQSWEHMNRSQIHECGNWERGRAVSFLGIFVSNFRYSIFAVNMSHILGLIP